MTEAPKTLRVSLVKLAKQNGHDLGFLVRATCACPHHRTESRTESDRATAHQGASATGKGPTWHQAPCDCLRRTAPDVLRRDRTATSSWFGVAPRVCVWFRRAHSFCAGDGVRLCLSEVGEGKERGRRRGGRAAGHAWRRSGRTGGATCSGGIGARRHACAARYRHCSPMQSRAW